MALSIARRFGDGELAVKIRPPKRQRSNCVAAQVQGTMSETDSRMRD